MDNQDWFLLALEGVAVLLLICLFLMRFAISQKQKIAQQTQKLQQAQQQQKKQAQQIKALMAGAKPEAEAEAEAEALGYSELLQQRLESLQNQQLDDQAEDTEVEANAGVVDELSDELSDKSLPELSPQMQLALQQAYLKLELNLEQDLDGATEDVQTQIQAAGERLFNPMLNLWWQAYSSELQRTPEQQAVANVEAREVQTETDLGMSIAEAATLLANYTQESQQMLSVIKDLEQEVETLEQQVQGSKQTA